MHKNVMVKTHSYQIDFLLQINYLTMINVIALSSACHLVFQALEKSNSLGILRLKEVVIYTKYHHCFNFQLCLSTLTRF